MYIIHDYLDYNYQEMSQFISQEVILCSLRCEVYDILDVF